MAHAGILGTPYVGRTRPGDRNPAEPHYHTSISTLRPDVFEGTSAEPGCPDGDWVFDEGAVAYPPNGGNFAMEYRGSQGGWVSDGCSLVQLMMQRSVGTGNPRANDSTSSGGAQTGAFDGTSSLAWQPSDGHELPDGTDLTLSAGFHIAAMFNKRDADTEGATTGDLRHRIAPRSRRSSRRRSISPR